MRWARCMTYIFVCVSVAKVGAVDGEKVRQTVNELRLREA